MSLLREHEITGRVVHVHHKGEFYYVNCDFRGAMYEHGIQELIELHILKQQITECYKYRKCDL